MSATFETEPIIVAAGTIAVIEGGELEQIRVRAGTIWATDASGRDLVIAAGETAVVQGHGKIVVSGLNGPAMFEHFALQPEQQLAA